MVDRDTRTLLTFSEGDQHHFMTEALAESRKALPACQPNPPVGCVIVRGTDHRVAWLHRSVPANRTPRLGRPLRPWCPDAAPEGLAMFVTLEPCAFVGRTPSCARALVMSGIRTVFVGMLDPDPRNNGAGIEIMRERGHRRVTSAYSRRTSRPSWRHTSIRPRHLSMDDQFR